VRHRLAQQRRLAEADTQAVLQLLEAALLLRGKIDQSRCRRRIDFAGGNTAVGRFRGGDVFPVR
jgi:DUF917 family protein